MSRELFNIWFPAIVVALVIGLVVNALWEFVIRRRFGQFVSRFRPGILKEVGSDSLYQSRAEAEDHHREISEKLNIFARVMNLLVSPKSSNSGEPAAFDIEAQTEVTPHHATQAVIRMTGTSAVQGTYSISTSSENHMYPGETFQGVDCRPITIIFTSFFPDGTSKDVTRPAKRLYRRHANGPVKRIKSSIILQASIVIDPWVLAEIVELAKHCLQKEKRCIFQLGNWAILYHNAGEVQLHLLKEGDVPVNVEARWQDGKTGITMRGLYLTGSQVKVGTKRTSKILRSAGPATQGAGDLDELHLPTGKLYVPGEDSLIYTSKVVVIDGVSLIVRSEASFILPPREKNALIESVWTRWLRISNSAKKMLLSLLFGAEDCQLERAANRPEMEFDPEKLELNVEHWKGLSEIELLNTRKEVLLYLQKQRASGIIEGVGPPSPHSHLIFVRDENYLECWQEGLRVLNEVIRRNSNDSLFHTHVRVRGGIHFLLGDLESALQDYDLAHLNTGGHQSTALLDRALVKCKLGRYSEAMQDVVAVITLNPNVNDIQELQACIQQILDQQISFRIVTQSGPSCQRQLLPDQDNSKVEIPDLLTGEEWHSGEIGSLRPISDAGAAGGSASDPPSKRSKSVGVARAAVWSLTSIAEALKLQLELINYAQALEMNPRYHVRRISFIVNILEDVCDPDDVVILLSTEDQEMLNWQASTEDLQDDLKVRNVLGSLSGRLCAYKNISLSLYDKVIAQEGNVQRRGPHPLSCYRHVSCRSAMLTKHSAADGDVQTLFLYDGTPEDRSCWRWRSHDYIKELVLPEARSPYRAFWLVQWDVVDMWHVVQADPDRGLCSNPAAVEGQGDLRKFHSFRSPWIAEVAAAGTSFPTSDGNSLNRHRGGDARRNPRVSIPVNEKPQTSRQTQPLRASGVDRVFPTISENSTCGGDSTVDSSSMNACKTTLRTSMKPWQNVQEEEKVQNISRFKKGMQSAIEVFKAPNVPTKEVLPERTCGIEVDNVLCNIGITIWDMAGQADYRSFHELVSGSLSTSSITTMEMRSLSEVLRSDDTRRISGKWNRKDDMQELKIENGLQVAVKKGSYHDLRRIVKQESAVLAGLTHPNICKLFKISRTGLPATELMKNDLRSIIDSRIKGLPEGSTPFSWRETLDIMLQLAAAMAYLQDYNVAHRDLKCQNILCTPVHTLAESGSAFRLEHYYSVKLADFGVAKTRIQSSDGETLMAGISGYLAPEMLEVRECPLKADVYSFGMVCYEILTGKLPFEENRHQGLSLHARRPLENFLLQDVPEALAKLIHQCLNSNPAQRPTFDHIVTKLRECKLQAHEEMEDSAQVQFHVWQTERDDLCFFEQ